MTPETIKKKKEDLVKKHNALKDKIEEGKSAIRNMEAQLNGLPSYSIYEKKDRHYQVFG